MALKDIFTIQEMSLDKKDFSYDINSKEFEIYWNNECDDNPTDNHYKVISD